MDDSMIVDLFLKRDEDALRQVTEKYGTRMLRIAQRITEDEETAKECVNDTYLEAWKRIPPSEPREYLMAFLAKIVRARALDRCAHDQRLKRKAYVEELTTELEQCIPSGTSIEEEMDGVVFAEAIGRFLKNQPLEKRRVFVRRYYYLEKTSSIAQRLGYSDNKVRTMLSRMRRELKDFLMKEELL